MNFTLKPIAPAVLAAAAQFAGVAYAQAPKAPAAPVTAPAARPAPAATKTPIPIKTPEDWIIYDDSTYTPVVDDVSRHLRAARKAFDAKDEKKAAAELRIVADELKLQAARADKEDRALVREDRALVAADTQFAQDTMKRMNATALKVGSAAAAIESGKVKSEADLDKVIDKAARADMERRWLVTDVTTWYPVSEEPQRHFTDAIAAYARKDYKAAATDIRKAISYLRLEANRATGAARQELASSVAQLDTLAAAVAKGALKDEQSMTKAFARADHALALAHRSNAAESWARKEYDKAGYELKAAAHGLEGAAGWVGREATAGATATVAEAQAVGDKLVSGASWTRDEVAKGFESLGNGINAVGQKIGGTKKASPFDETA
ncbi:MAG TPA: hypothetical protein PLE54_09755 [Burkholderiaceae bacterium]|nr:hypothetical protein [Burkholderiaceae bacterium]HQR70875.1 hypothetical protein [Burkholderiaceae bacterium]